MLKQYYKYIAVFLLVGAVISCSSDALDDKPLTEGDVPIEVSGMLTRALGDLGDSGDGKLITTGYPLETIYKAANVNFFLTARTTTAPVGNYFLSRPITIGAKNTNDQGRNKLDGTVYYPLGEKEINLFAHTVSADASGNITLTAGTERANDVLFGKGTNDLGIERSGKSDDPIEYITFNHLMTRVDVKIEVDGSVQDTKPQSITMQFARNGADGFIVNKGTFNIFNGVTAANKADGEYSFSNITTTATTHYLVPNGANLSNTSEPILSYLKIDDYVADAESGDLSSIKFPKTDKENDFILNPGLAYDLTFKINRLKILEIKLTLKDWIPKSGSTEWGYKPKSMTLNTGTEYVASEITKMVLKYTHGGQVYQYIGEKKGDKIDFVTLPETLTAGTLTADLYTTDGLLSDDVTIEPSGTNLNVLNLGQYGMKKNGDRYEISTPLQLALLINKGATADRKYLIVNSLDMTNTSVKLTTSKVFPTDAELDGNGQDILHLDITGNGLFTENSGTLKNFRIASGLIKGNASICETNNGKIEAVVNQADIQPVDGIAGGIAGTNGGNGTILATVNTGNVLGGTTVGGIAGENKSTSAGAIAACLNVGQLNKAATNLGGIIGTSVAGTSIVNTCYWLTGTARKNQGASNELAIGNNPANETDTNSADLAASSIRSTEVITKLNGVSSPWVFKLEAVRSSWPIATTQP
ncbi:MAG TPA: hypothetical protein DEF88_12335 [Porphyromonadaceae bacterium]|jgi:hypothetical protein|nr:hypothetical protein [Porphyromonadaceae bacterium]HBX21225.1 hypothetical protein [Porphyromonadaceae bacterium]